MNHGRGKEADLFFSSTPHRLGRRVGRIVQVYIYFLLNLYIYQILFVQGTLMPDSTGFIHTQAKNKSKVEMRSCTIPNVVIVKGGLKLNRKLASTASWHRFKLDGMVYKLHPMREGKLL
jgi:hypothetical protein